MEPFRAKFAALSGEVSAAGFKALWSIQPDAVTEKIDLDDCTAEQALSLVDNPDQADCALSVGERLSHGHAVLLKKHSNFLAPLFDEDMQQKNEPLSVPLPHSALDEIIPVLQYLYTGCFPRRTVTPYNLIAVAKNADYLGAQTLYEDCTKRLASHWKESLEEHADRFSELMTVQLMTDTLTHMVPQSNTETS
jgi:hypothetical protein